MRRTPTLCVPENRQCGTAVVMFVNRCVRVFLSFLSAMSKLVGGSGNRTRQLELWVSGVSIFGHSVDRKWSRWMVIESRYTQMTTVSKQPRKTHQNHRRFCRSLDYEVVTTNGKILERHALQLCLRTTSGIWLPRSTWIVTSSSIRVVSVRIGSFRTNSTKAYTRIYTIIKFTRKTLLTSKRFRGIYTQN